MLNLRDIKVLHLEPTDVCQAACGQTAQRTQFDQQWQRETELNV